MIHRRNTNASASKDTPPRRRWLRFRRKDADRGFELNSETDTQCGTFPVLPESWRGPLLTTPGMWQRDLLSITREIQGIVRVNAPLAPGLDAVAREIQRQKSGRSLFVRLLCLLAAIVYASPCILLWQRDPAMLAVAAVSLSLPLLIVVFLRERRSPILALILLVALAAAMASLAAGHAPNPRFIMPGIPIRWSELMEAPAIILTVICAYVFLRVLCKWRTREAILIRLRDTVASGEPLSEAMNRLPRFFPPVCVDLVKTGEETGRLESCLDKLVEHLESRVATFGYVFPVIAYLSGMALFQSAFAVFYITRIQPVFSELISEFGGQVHTPLTSVLAALPHIAQYWMPDFVGNTLYFLFHESIFSETPHLLLSTYVLLALLAPALVLGLWSLYLRRLRRGVSGRAGATLLLALPGTRGLIMYTNLCAMTDLLRRLIDAGTPLDEALDQVAATELTPVYARALRRVRDRIRQGETLADALRTETSSFRFPSSFTAMIAMGEHSGMLGEALGYLHTCYRSQLELRKRTLRELAMPAGVAVLGLFTLGFLSEVMHFLTAMADSIMNAF